MKLIIDIDEDIRRAISQMGLLRIPDEMQKKVDEAIQHSIPFDKLRAEMEKAVWEDVVVSLDGTDEVRIPRLDPDDVFEIINKYKPGSEG